MNLTSWTLVAVGLGACSASARPGGNDPGGAGGNLDGGQTAVDGGSLGGAVGLDATTDVPPGSPDFGPNVLIFDPSMSMATIQSQIDAVYVQQANSQFGTNRYALLFKPGAYNLSVKVGYYTQVLGLGSSPEDVVINGTVQSTGNSSGNATLSFWRSCENLTVAPPLGQTVMWAVSQGAALRRVHVKGALTLADSGNSSGGFMADSKIDGRVTSGSQQQWLSRNSQWGSWTGGVWNMVFVGTVAPPPGTWPAAPYTVVSTTPVVREKSYLFLDSAGHIFVMIPGLKRDTVGVTWPDATGSPGLAVPIEQFYLANPGRDNAATINAALGQGKHLLLTPGIYHLEAAILVTRPHAVVLGLGMATLVPDNATSALIVADVDDVTIDGIIVDAGPTSSPALLQIGAAASLQDHSQAPTFLHDVFCRVGGASAGTAANCATVNSNDVVGDNLWMWRADHGAGAGWTQNRSATGLVVNGRAVTMYGLFVEHFQEFQTLWNGEGGQLFFYQSEMPYDPPDQPSWQHAGANGYPAFKVADAVMTHQAWGLGVYCAFRALVAADDALEAPVASAVTLHHMVTVWLSGAAGSAINHIVNGTGAAVTQASRRATAD